MRTFTLFVPFFILVACGNAAAPKVGAGGGGGVTSNIYGGLRDTNPDGSVRRADRSEIITPGRLTDVDDDGNETQVETGTVATTSEETGPSTTNDTDTSTPSDKITKDLAEPADDDEPSDGGGFGAEST